MYCIAEMIYQKCIISNLKVMVIQKLLDLLIVPKLFMNGTKLERVPSNQKQVALEQDIHTK